MIDVAEPLASSGSVSVPTTVPPDPGPCPLQVPPTYKVNSTEPVGLLSPVSVTVAVSETEAPMPSVVATMGAPFEFTTVVVQLCGGGQTVKGSQLPVEDG